MLLRNIHDDSLPGTGKPLRFGVCRAAAREDQDADVSPPHGLQVVGELFLGKRVYQTFSVFFNNPILPV